MIYVVQSTTDETATYGEYDNGADAAARSRELNAQWQAEGSEKRTRVVRKEAPAEAPEDMVYLFGHKTMPDAITPAELYAHYSNWRIEKVPASGADWRERELRRPGRTRLPWKHEPWWQESEHWPMHFPYPASSDAGKIAFTQSEERGREDRQTVMRPGAYLARYFSEHLTECDIQRWALAWATEFAPCELELAYDADEIQEVYENGPNSCMSYYASDYAGGIHPVRAYAGPDLALAYIRNGDGDITGRALVWPDRMIHGRIYGDCERMADALQREGYSSSDLSGARLTLIRAEDGVGIHAPFVDGNARACETPDGKYLILGDGNLYLDSTNGLVSAETCEDCGRAVDEDDCMRDPHGNGYTYCLDCYNDRYAYCEDCGEDCYRDDMCEAPDGILRCHDCHVDAVTDCEACDRECMRDESYSGPDGVVRCDDCNVEAVTICEDCNDEVMREDCGIHPNGGDVCRDCAPDDDAEEAPPVRRAPAAPVPDSTDPAQLELTPAPVAGTFEGCNCRTCNERRARAGHQVGGAEAFYTGRAEGAQVPA